MKVPSPVKLARMVSRAVKNREMWEAQAARRVTGASGSVTATYHLKPARFESLAIEGASSELQEEVLRAVNDALAKADAVWREADAALDS